MIVVPSHNHQHVRPFDTMRRRAHSKINTPNGKKRADGKKRARLGCCPPLHAFREHGTGCGPWHLLSLHGEDAKEEKPQSKRVSLDRADYLQGRAWCMASNWQ